jgi:hypothetical protein
VSWSRAKVLRNPHAEATTGADLQVPAFSSTSATTGWSCGAPAQSPQPWVRCALLSARTCRTFWPVLEQASKTTSQSSPDLRTASVLCPLTTTHLLLSWELSRLFSSEDDHDECKDDSDAAESQASWPVWLPHDPLRIDGRNGHDEQHNDGQIQE